MPILGTADQDSSNRKDLINIRWSTFLTLVSLLVGSAAYSQTAPELEYDAVAPLRLPPNLYLGEAAGVAVNIFIIKSSIPMVFWEELLL